MMRGALVAADSFGGGSVRIVRNAKRARKLRRRGVRLWDCGDGWIWLAELVFLRVCAECFRVNVFAIDENGIRCKGCGAAGAGAEFVAFARSEART